MNKISQFSRIQYEGPHCGPLKISIPHPVECFDTEETLPITRISLILFIEEGKVPPTLTPTQLMFLRTGRSIRECEAFLTLNPLRRAYHGF